MIDAILRSLSNIFLICVLNPAKKKVLPNKEPWSVKVSACARLYLPAESQSEANQVGDDEPCDVVVSLSGILQAHAPNKHEE